MEKPVAKQKGNSIINIPNPENLFNGETPDSYSSNMEKLFADENQRFREKEKEASPVKPTIFFTAAGFLRKDNESQKVGVILNSDPRDEQLYFVMYDKEKTVLRRILVESTTFEFVEEELNVVIIDADIGSENVVFIDRGDFLRFAITTLIRSSNQHCFILNSGVGDREISADSALLYDRTIYRTDEKSLALPIENKGTKTKLSEEKLATHQTYKWLRGLRRGCHLLIRSGEEVHEIFVVKEKKQAVISIPEPSESAQKPNDIFVDKEEKAEEEAELVSSESSEKFENPEPPAPEESPKKPGIRNSLVPEDLQKPETSVPAPEEIRDILHRIVGIELDRIEMRLNAKFEQLRLDVNAHLNRQTELPQKLVDKHS